MRAEGGFQTPASNDPATCRGKAKKKSPKEKKIQGWWEKKRENDHRPPLNRIKSITKRFRLRRKGEREKKKTELKRQEGG